MNNEIKSQDDLNRQGRESDVLIATIMKCQELVKEKVELENDNKGLKNQNKRLREIIEVCQRYFDNQRVTDAWADNIKMDIDDVMGDDGMEKIDD